MKALLHTIIARIHCFFRPGSLDSDFNEELEAHITMAAEDKIRRGMTPEEARRAARVELGGMTQLRESARAARGLPLLDNFGLDIRLGLRMMRKSWGLTLIGGLAMAVAISVGASAFAVLDASWGNTVPLEEGDRIVRLLSRDRDGGATSVQDFELWREHMRSVEGISAFSTVERLLVTAGSSGAQVSVAQMTSSGFRVARVQPLIGRPLLEEDEREDAPAVVVISYDIWQSRFAGDREAVGRTLQLGGVDRIVVGIMPEDFAFPVNHEVWIPFRPNRLSDGRQADSNVAVFGRLAPGVTIERARAEIAGLGAATGESQANQEIRTVSPYAASFGHPPSAWDVALPLLLALLLVPPCANIAILIYARNVTRQEEFAARYVLGAGRGRIVGQLLVEAFVLAAAAGGVGLVMAHQFLKEFRSGVIDSDLNFAFWMKPSISFETVLYVAGLAAFAAMIAGGLPAFRATRRMRKYGFHGTGTRTSPQLGMTWTVLVVAQVALSTAVLPMAGELMWMLLHPNIIAREFAAAEYVTTRILLEDDKPGRFRELQTELVREVQAGMGVSAVTVSASIDGIHEAFGQMEMEGAGRQSVTVVTNHVDDAYFDVFKAPVLAGRAFETADFNPGRPVVIVNRTFAEKIPGQNPLGKRVRYFGNRDGDSEQGRWYEIIGLVDEISSNTPRARIYHPMLPQQTRQGSLTLQVGPTIPSDFTRRLLGITTAVDPNLHVEELGTLADMYQKELREDNILGFAVSTIVLVVVLFSAAGIHTLVAFAVAQRRREIGIRSALGAPPLHLVASVFRRDLSPVLVGAVVGAFLAFPVHNFMPTSSVSLSMTFSVPAALMFMFAIGLLAVAGPAHRLLRVDSTEALRES